MRYQAVMMLFSGAIGLCLSGCVSTSPVMRGQSPDVQQVGWNSCGESAGNSRAHRRGGQQRGGGFAYGGCPNGACENGTCPGGACQTGACPGGACQNGQCYPGGMRPDRCCNLPFHPVHRNFHTYDVPNGLTYPQQDAPPATYQNPYYTTRGPTDFFMK